MACDANVGTLHTINFQSIANGQIISAQAGTGNGSCIQYAIDVGVLTSK